jgi:hypothetical protein
LTEKVTVFTGNQIDGREYTQTNTNEISNFEIEEIIGTLITVNIPDDVWNTGADGKKFINRNLHCVGKTVPQVL